MSAHWIQTYTGRAFDLLDPQPDMVNIEDIAHALSMICRFTGHTDQFYSVAQHSILVASLVPIEHAFAGLMHDATEAYVGDMSSPLKVLLPTYKSIERNIWRVIAIKFGLPHKLPPCVRDADIVALMSERDCLLGPSPKSWEGALELAPRTFIDKVMTPAVAERQFQKEFSKLMRVAQESTA